MNPETAYIYVVGMPGVQAVKVGWAADVSKRLAGLQTGSPFPLSVLWKHQVPDAPAVEAALHHQFHRQRVRGEWFDLGPDAARVVREACRSITADIHHVTLGATGVEMVLSVLREAGNEGAVTAQLITGRTPLNYANVRMILSRLVKQGQAKAVARNLYAIAPEVSR